MAILGKPTPKYGSIEHKTQLEVRRLIKEGIIRPDELNETGTGILMAAGKADAALGDAALDGRDSPFAPSK